MTIDLTPFAAGYHFGPFSRGEYSYAVNGHIGVRIPRRDDVEENRNAPDVEAVFARQADDLAASHMAIAILPLPPIKTVKCGQCDGEGKVVKCSECDGEGVLECDLGHEHDCEECGGTGLESARGEDETQHAPCSGCEGSGQVPEGATGRDVCVVFPGNHGVNLRYVRLLQTLPGARWRLDGRKSTEDPIPFWFEGGEGILMPMRAPRSDSPSCIYVEDVAA